ncbi:MAG: hypothetical protein M3492_11830, partial [Actinomycetota bacterium]|nr:hypothetical protein [Actinomycetota bacterium]
MTTVALAILLGIVLVVSLTGWWQPAPVFPAVATALMFAAIVVASSMDGVGRAALIVCTALAVTASAAGGGPLTVAILARASYSTAPRIHEPGRPYPTPAEDLLRG